MPALESALRTRLASQVPALTGGDGIARIYPLKLPPLVVLPAVEYMLVSEDPDLTHSGNPSLTMARFQFSIWADTYSGMITIAQGVLAAFHGYRGTIDGVRIDGGRLLTQHDDYDEDVKKWRRVADYGFFYTL